MSLATQISALATRVRDQFNALRDGWLSGGFAWSAVPEAVVSTLAMTAGTATLVRARVSKAGTVSFVGCNVSTAGATLTTAGIQVYNTAGTLLGQTANLNATFTTGVKAYAITAPFPVVVGQEVWIVLFAIGTTGPTLRATTAAPVLNQLLTVSSPYRVGRRTGVVAAPTSVVVANYSTALTQLPFFVLH